LKPLELTDIAGKSNDAAYQVPEKEDCLVPDSFETATAPIASVEQATEQSGITDVVARLPDREKFSVSDSSQSATSSCVSRQHENDQSSCTDSLDFRGSKTVRRVARRNW
jgi:hypothetical protein